MKTLQQILLEASNEQKTELRKHIDRTSPSGIIEKHIGILKNQSPNGLISMLKINHLLKTLILSEVILVEDILATSIYNSEFGKTKCKDILENNNFFSKDKNSKNKEKFKEILKNKVTKEMTYLKKIFLMFLIYLH